MGRYRLGALLAAALAATEVPGRERAATSADGSSALGVLRGWLVQDSHSSVAAFLMSYPGGARGISPGVGESLEHLLP
jgi:hypothetical protein